LPYNEGRDNALANSRRAFRYSLIWYISATLHVTVDEELLVAAVRRRNSMLKAAHSNQI